MFGCCHVDIGCLTSGSDPAKYEMLNSTVSFKINSSNTQYAVIQFYTLHFLSKTLYFFVKLNVGLLDDGYEYWIYMRYNIIYDIPSLSTLINI